MADVDLSKRSAAEDLLAQVDTGGRDPVGWQKNMILVICFLWACFQLYIASNLPFWLTENIGVNVVVESFLARRIHFSFALLLAAFVFPLWPGAVKDRIPWYDWVLAAASVAASFYAVVNYEDISNRSGSFQPKDAVAATLGLVMLAIAVYRALGLPLMIVAVVFVFYVFFGDARWLPEAMQWKGASYGKATWHFWIQDEGVFGVALKVSTELIFLFVLFGAILEKAGAGNYFIKIAFALLGHLRGGPAKAAVAASAMSGLYSGSSIANVVTTGTFTIPLMKRTGFSPEKAGAVEVASSTNGQLTPPVMGAAAFLIAEFTGVPYTDIIRHALVPAVVSYIALVYIVHLEALKMGLKGLPPHERQPNLCSPIVNKLLGALTGFLVMVVLTGGVIFMLGWIKTAIPDYSFLAIAGLCMAAYLALLWLAAGVPDLTIDDPNAPVTELPKAGDTARTGYYYILPIVILIWCIIVERLSPSLSAFWATLSMIFVAVTQHPLKAIMRGQYRMIGAGTVRGLHEWFDGMISGSRNMISIGVATGAAGIVVGTISLTGAHQIVGELVEYLSGGSLIVMLMLVAVMSLILGMGLPTTANYIVVSSLMAPVIVVVGAQSGLVVPLIAVHLFVFYFGILADDTPPVGLAAFAAAAISQGDPIKTGVQGFMYDIRTALLPFLFIFNTDLLLIDVGFWQAIFVFVVAVVAMMCFAAATQGYFFAKNRIWEAPILLLIAFTLFRPGYWLDQVQAPFHVYEGPAILKAIKDLPEGTEVRIVLSGPDFDSGKISQSTLAPKIGKAGDGTARLKALGLTVMVENAVVKVDEPLPTSPFFKKLSSAYDFYSDEPVRVLKAEIAADRMPKELFMIPALLLLLLLIFWQRRRATQPAF